MELRRPFTAAAAASVLIALMFVPSASATAGETSSRAQVPASAARAGTAASASGAGAPQTGLADTGSIDTTPYLLGGTAFLGVGTGLVLYARRREAEGF